MSSELTPEEILELEESIFTAARDGRAEVIQTLLSGLPPDLVKQVLNQFSRDGFGFYKRTPLAVAAHYGRVEVVHLLLNDYDVNIDLRVAPGQRNRWYSTALVSAALGGHLDIIQLLVAKGCDVDLGDSEGETALIVACRKNRLDIAKFLLENGAQLEVTNSDGFTCLMRACCNGDVELVRYLAEKGADLNKKNEEDWTALHFAALDNAAEVVNYLLEQGAVVSRNKDGHTPIITAAIMNSPDAVDCFFESPDIPLEEKIDGLELLGAMMVLTEMDGGLDYLHKAMTERYRDPCNVVPKPLSPLPLRGHLQESRTLRDLETRNFDQDTLQLECLAIVGRILGLNNRWVVGCYSKCFEHLKSRRRYSEAVALLLWYAKTATDLSVGIFHTHMDQFLEVFGAMLVNEVPPLFSDVQQALELTLERMQQFEIPKHAGLVYLCMQIVLIGLKVAQRDEEKNLLVQLTQLFLSFRPLLFGGRSVLHEAVEEYWHRDHRLRNANALPYASLVSLLLACGDEANAKDADGDRPLHVIASCQETDDSRETLTSITWSLIHAGALVNVQNRHGLTPMDSAASPTVQNILRQCLPVSLKSLAATAVLQNNIPFESTVPAAVAEYVRWH